MPSDFILDISNLSKSFSGVKVLHDVSLSIRKGEVHALMGENGAGKSTLMKILIGMLKADSGTIILDGESVVDKRILEIQKMGISMIHQELLVVPELTVAQNIYLGREKQIQNIRWLNDNRLNESAGKLLNQLGLDIRPNAKMKFLSVAETQMVEIAKAVSNDAKVIIMDEPTSAISDKEVSSLFRIIADLKRNGVAIIYISHKMDEIFQIADTISVLRDGRLIGTNPASETNIQALITMMVGREITQLFPETESDIGDVILEVKDLCILNGPQNISFQLRAGQILGIAGLMGAGRTEIARAIYGLDKITSGDIMLRGKSIQIGSVRNAIENGIAYVSEDRKALGFVPEMSVKENVTLSSLAIHTTGIFVNEKSERTAVTQMVSKLRIKSDGIDQKLKNLSGGNQQKVVIAKILQSSPEIIMLDEPTRGVDIGAKFEIYKLIHELKTQGKAIILISSELPEILGMSDEIMVLAHGRQTAIFSGKEATEELIMKHAF